MTIDKVVVEESEEVKDLNTAEKRDYYSKLYNAAMRKKDERLTFKYRQLFKYYDQMLESEQIHDRLRRYVSKEVHE